MPCYCHAYISFVPFSREKFATCVDDQSDCPPLVLNHLIQLKVGECI